MKKSFYNLGFLMVLLTAGCKVQQNGETPANESVESATASVADTKAAGGDSTASSNIGPDKALNASKDLAKAGKPALMTPAGAACEEGTALDVEVLVLETMEIVGTKNSQTKKVLTAKLVGHVAKEELPNDGMRAAWIGVLARENKFESSLTSSAGAVGIGQLIPKYAKDFGKPCGYGDPSEADLKDDHVNLRLSACFFKALVNLYLTNDKPAVRRAAIPLAMASYNAGQHSENVKRLLGLSSMSDETANYLAVIWTTMLMVDPNNICKKS